jgi:hypothetical protein
MLMLPRSFPLLLALLVLRPFQEQFDSTFASLGVAQLYFLLARMSTRRCWSWVEAAQAAQGMLVEEGQGL